MESDDFKCLLDILENLDKVEFQRFQKFLNTKVREDIEPIPKRKLDNNCIDDTAVTMIDHYGQDLVLEITKEIIITKMKLKFVERPIRRPDGTEATEFVPLSFDFDDSQTTQKKSRKLLLTVLCYCGMEKEVFSRCLNRALLAYFILLLMISIAVTAYGAYIWQMFQMFGVIKVEMLLCGCISLVLPALGLFGMCRQSKCLLCMCLVAQMIGMFLLIFPAEHYYTLIQESKNAQISIQEAIPLNYTDKQPWVLYLHKFQKENNCCGLINGTKDWGDAPPTSCWDRRLPISDKPIHEENVEWEMFMHFGASGSEPTPQPKYSKPCLEIMTDARYDNEVYYLLVVLFAVLMICGFFMSLRVLTHLCKKACVRGNCCTAIRKHRQNRRDHNV